MSNQPAPMSEEALQQTILAAVDTQRLLDTAIALVGVPSPTRSAGAVADHLAEILAADGFAVERPEADWPEAPAVAVRFSSGQPGPILQFNGHLDTVHLPFIPPRVEDDILYGSGASDMKGGIAAFVEALRVIRDHNLLQQGGILLTAHDHHEGPWGDRRQLRGLIRDGYVGDAVMLPEYLANRLPVAGRGMTIFEVEIRRDGERIHETLRPSDTPDVIAAGVLLHQKLQEYHARVISTTAPHAGHDTVFVGLFQAGEIFNQSPTSCKIKGTRRWVTPGQTQQVLDDLRTIFDSVAEATHTQIDYSFDVTGDAFRLDEDAPFVRAFQAAYRATRQHPLIAGTKPFVDDGNIFAGEAGIPAITHGPDAHGAHTTDERVPVAELVRVAQVYALTAAHYCNSLS